MSATANISASLWQKLPQAFFYPLHIETGLTILFASLLSWLFSASLFGLSIVIAAVTAMTQFLLVNLRHSANGGDEPPRMDSREFFEFRGTPFQLLLAIAVGTALCTELGRLNAYAGFVAAACGFILLPAFTVLLALEQSIAYALNPGRLLRFTLRGGLPYLLLTAASGVTFRQAFVNIRESVLAENFAASLIFSPPKPATFIWLLGGFYLASALVHLLGLIARRAHDFRPPDGHEIEVVSKAPAADSAEAHAMKLDELLRAGKREETLHAWAALDDRDHVFQQALLDALILARAWALVPRQAQRCISKLLAVRRKTEALQTLLRVLNTHESFVTATAAEWLALCETARDMQRGDWLTLLAGKAPAKFPDDPALLDIALVHAQFVAHANNDFEQAFSLLEPFTGWQTHPRYQNLLRFRGALQSMRGT